jgi:hypothetical protein
VTAEPWYARHPTPNATKWQPESDLSAALDVAYPVTFFDSTTDETVATPIALTGGSREEANFNLCAVPALHLTVESPISQNGVSVGPSLRQTIFGTTFNTKNTGNPITHNNTDEFEITGVAPGHYELTQGDPPRVAELDVSNSQQIDPNLGALTAALTGSLRSAEASALPETFSIVLISPDESQNHAAPLVTRSNGGTFSFAAVPPGSWDLWAFANGKNPMITSLTVGSRTRPGNQFTMRDQPLKIVATISLSEARVEGFARNKEGKGQSGVMMVLIPKDPLAFDSLVRRDQSDSDGSFSLRDVAPGEYTVVAIADGWELDWERPEVIGRYLSSGVAVTVAESSGKRVLLPQAVPVQSR